MRDGWQIKTLREVCEVDKSQGIHESLPYVGLEDIESHTGRFIGSTQARRVKSSTFKFSPDHLLYGRLRPYLNKVMLPEFVGHCSTEIFPLRPRPGLSREFLQYWFLTDRTVDAIDATSTGTRMPRADISAVLGLEFPLAPLPEQRRIVGILNGAFERISTAKADAEKNLQNARALLESGLNAATTGALTRDWRHAHRPAAGAGETVEERLRQRRHGKGRRPRPPVTDKPIEMPRGWVLASPEEVSTHIVDCPHSTPKWTKSGAVCLRTTNFKPGFLDLESLRFVSEETYRERISRLEPEPGDVLYSREGGILGIACVMPLRLRACLGQRMMQFRLDTSVVLPDFFVGVLNSTLVLSEVRRLTGGAAAPHLNIRDIKTFPIPLPSMGEQRRIVEMLDRITCEAQRLESVYLRKLAALDELKQSLLHQAFTGQLTMAAA